MLQIQGALWCVLLLAGLTGLLVGLFRESVLGGHSTAFKAAYITGWILVILLGLAVTVTTFALAARFGTRRSRVRTGAAVLEGCLTVAGALIAIAVAGTAVRPGPAVMAGAPATAPAAVALVAWVCLTRPSARQHFMAASPNAYPPAPPTVP